MIGFEKGPSLCQDALHPIVRVKPNPSQRIRAHIEDVALWPKAKCSNPDVAIPVWK